MVLKFFLCVWVHVHPLRQLLASVVANECFMIFAQRVT
jgi:hypothetical protein